MSRGHWERENMPTDIERAWRSYQRTHSGDDRNTLIEHYLPIVRYNAQRIHAKLPPAVELDDLLSAGLFGLMDAVAKYDPARGVKFETYCVPRIRGAIFDELRKMDWMPRLTRQRSATIHTAAVKLRNELSREPTAEEIRRRLKLSRAEFAKVHGDTAVDVASLSRKVFETDSNRDVRSGDLLADRRARDPLNESQRADFNDFITRGLSRAERLIFLLYYEAELTMLEIGVVLGLSESRVSQMHKKVLPRLKVRLMEHGWPSRARLTELGLV